MTTHSLDQWLNDLPALARQHQAALAGHNGLFRVETAQGRRWDILLADGTVQITEPGTAAPTCTILADESILLDMLGGRLSPAKALLFGKVKLKGDPKPLLALAALVK